METLKLEGFVCQMDKNITSSSGVYSTCYSTYGLHCSSLLGLPFRILNIDLAKPTKGTTMETTGMLAPKTQKAGHTAPSALQLVLVPLEARGRPPIWQGTRVPALRSMGLGFRV